MKRIFLCFLVISLSVNFSNVYGQDGTIDTSFANKGIFVNSFPVTDFLCNFVVQPDNKIVGAQLRRFSLIRVTENGELDSSFGVNGITPPILTMNDNYLYKVALQPDGKIIGVGASNKNYAVQDFRSAILRFNPDGTVDSSFGIDGTVINDLSLNEKDLFSSVLVQPDAKILVGGCAYTDPYYVYDLVLFRYDSNGKPDQTFGDSGQVRVNRAGAEDLVNVVLRSDGKIVASTITRGGNYTKSVVIHQFNNDGTPDSTFGNHGATVTPIGAGDDQTDHSMLLQPDGKILFGGFMTINGNRGFLLRYNTTGMLDSTFAQDGMFLFDVYSKVTSLGLLPDGKIIATIEKFDYTFLRLNADGSIDSTFGNNGWVINGIGPKYFSKNATSVSFQHGGRIIVAGYANYFNPDTIYCHDLVITRYLSGIPCPDPAAHFSYQVNETIVSFFDDSSSANKWRWDFGDGSYSSDQNPVHTYGQIGKFHVCLDITDTCGSTQYCDSVSLYTDSAHHDITIGTKLYPNPSSDYIIVENATSGSPFTSLQLSDSHGLIVRYCELALSTKQIKISISDLLPGMYFLKLWSDQSYRTLKLIKM